MMRGGGGGNGGGGGGVDANGRSRNDGGAVGPPLPLEEVLRAAVEREGGAWAVSPEEREAFRVAGLYTSSRIQLTHSLKAPGFNP
jgi:hypothetical protein